MTLDSDVVLRIHRVIEKSQKILIIPHKSPDGDAIGSSLALFLMLKKLGKEPAVICADPSPEEFNFLPAIEDFKASDISLKYDAVFILDCGATHLTDRHNSYPQLFDKSLEVINIDHHPSNDFYGRYNLVKTEAASTTVVLYHLFKQLNYPLDRHIATCLLTGIYTDTGSFMHSNTSAEVLRVAARLLAIGANLRDISKEIFNTTKISTMRLWGRVLKNIHQNSAGVTMSVVRQKDFEESGADYSEMTGVVDYVNSVPNAKYSVILTEREGKVKGSMRTLREEIDVAQIASRFGGGGHTKAAGFTLPGHLEQEVRWKVVK